MRTRVLTPDADQQAGTTATQLVTADPLRVALVVVNISSNVIYLLPRRGVSATRGVRLSPAGGSITLTIHQDFALVPSEWFVLASGANSAYVITQVLIAPD